MSGTEIQTFISAVNSLKLMVDTFLKREEDKNKVIQVKQKPLRRISIITDVGTSILKSYDQNKPSLVVENVDGFSKIKEISIAPDDDFKTKGLMIITVDDVKIYELKSLDVFQIINTQTISIPEGLTLKPNDKIKFLLISSDGAEVKLAVSVTFSD